MAGAGDGGRAGPDGLRQQVEPRLRRLQLERQQAWLAMVEKSGDSAALAHARDLASAGAVASAWLSAPPVSKNHQPDFRLQLGLRLGVTVVPQARGEGVRGVRSLTADPTGRMELGNMGGKSRRHREVRDVVVAHMRTAGQRFQVEQTVEQIATLAGVSDRTIVSEAKSTLAASYQTARAGAEEPRPSDLGVTPWPATARGAPSLGTSVTAVVDFTIVVPWSSHALSGGSAEMAVAARLGADRKIKAAAEAMAKLGVEFVPASLTVNGGMGVESAAFFKELVRREAGATFKPEDKVWEELARDLSIAIQRENGRILRTAGRVYASQSWQAAERRREDEQKRKAWRPRAAGDLEAVKTWLGSTAQGWRRVPDATPGQ